jgi:hydrogenase expression/formation protein HypE
MGKLSTGELQELLNCIKEDSRVLIAPHVGFDAGVHRLGNEYVAVATDPCTGVPMEWFGFLLVNYAASDVALFGAKPEFCTITLMRPLKTKPTDFREMMRQTANAANELGVAIVRGHTATYGSVCQPLGVCTVYGKVKPENLVTPKNARKDDLIVCTKPIGLETVVNFSLTHKDLAAEIFGKDATEKLAALVPLQSCVKEALELSKIDGVHTMHDATEGGLISALNELADASELGFELDPSKIPSTPQIDQLQKFFKLSDSQKLAMSSTGTIIAAIDPNVKEEVIEALSKLGLTGRIIGKLSHRRTRTLTAVPKRVKFPTKVEDPYARIMAKKTFDPFL